MKLRRVEEMTSEKIKLKKKLHETRYALYKIKELLPSSMGNYVDDFMDKSADLLDLLDADIKKEEKRG